MICKQSKSGGQGETTENYNESVREEGSAGRRHLAGRQLPDSARLESRGSCLPPCTSSITAYFPPNHTHRWRGEKIQSFLASQSSAEIHSFTLRHRAPKPASDRPPGRQRIMAGTELPSCDRFPIWKSPTGRLRNKWRRAFRGGNGFEPFKHCHSREGKETMTMPVFVVSTSL